MSKTSKKLHGTMMPVRRTAYIHPIGTFGDKARVIVDSTSKREGFHFESKVTTPERAVAILTRYKRKAALRGFAIHRMW
jgi:hypothetical protein